MITLHVLMAKGVGDGGDMKFTGISINHTYTTHEAKTSLSTQ